MAPEGRGVKLDWFAVARDVLLVLVLSFVVVQATALASGRPTLAILLPAAFLALVAGFFVSGRLRRERRAAPLAAHLSACAAGVWLLGGVLNSMTRGIPIEHWLRFALGAFLTVGAAALLGGALSLAFAPAAGAEAPRDPDAPKT
jgi:hypothetical protein